MRLRRSGRARPRSCCSATRTRPSGCRRSRTSPSSATGGSSHSPSRPVRRSTCRSGRPPRSANTGNARRGTRMRSPASAPSDPAIVFVGGYHLYEFLDGDDRVAVADDRTAWGEALGRMIAQIAPSASHVVLMADTPQLGVTPDECLASERDAVERCEQVRADVVDADYAAMEQAVATATGAQLISMTDLICPGATCPLIFGTTPVYRDNQHLVGDVRARTVTVDRPVAWFGGPVIQSVQRRFIVFAAGALLLISTIAGDLTRPDIGMLCPRPRTRCPSRCRWEISCAWASPPSRSALSSRLVSRTPCRSISCRRYPSPPRPRRAATPMAATRAKRHARHPDAHYGVTSSPVTVAILGDSHGSMWLPAIERIAAERGWRIFLLTKSACPPPECTGHRQEASRTPPATSGGRARSRSSSASSHSWSSRHRLPTTSSWASMARTPTPTSTPGARVSPTPSGSWERSADQVVVLNDVP